MKIRLAFALAAVSAALASAQEDIMQAAREHSPSMATLLPTVIPGLNAAAKNGVSTNGQDFLFAVNTDAAEATISVDGVTKPMMKAGSSTYWYRLDKLNAGMTHKYQFFAAGKPVLPIPNDIGGYNPDSFVKAGVPQGKLSEKIVITSKLYDGMKADFWIYAAAGVDPATPAPLMIWQDGQSMLSRTSGMRLFNVSDNLVAQKLIPPMVHVLIAPGIAADGKPLRAIQYDTVTDKYTRFLMEEVLPIVEKQYKLRQDGYSRAIGGSSSGAICAFTSAWFMNEKFTRVHSTVGSYTSIQWRPDEKLDGGNLYPFKVRKEPKRNIRIWMSDGADDLENNHGSWPLQNIQMANSLKMREYDFHFRFGTAAHNGAQATIDLPESLAWLWRGYDPAKTSETFVMDPAEKDKPYYRVRIANRDSW